MSNPRIQAIPHAAKKSVITIEENSISKSIKNIPYKNIVSNKENFASVDTKVGTIELNYSKT